MPYIPESARDRLAEELEENGISRPENAGELNYLLTELAIAYTECHGPGYTVFNDVVGALEGAKLEYYRRVVGPYEAEKARINGDLYSRLVRRLLAPFRSSR